MPDSRAQPSPSGARQAWLRLALAASHDSTSLAALVDAHGGAEALCEAARQGRSDVPQPLAAELAHPDPDRFERGLDWLARGGQVLGLGDPAYPDLLRQIARPPIALFVRGNVDALSLPQLAIVGSRNATGGGADTARSFAAYLAARGFCITSGLAEGIDGAAHRGALESRRPDGATGVTIAVCGTGADIVYPRTHIALADAIVDGGGALVSEFAPGTPVYRANFPRRNRLISGLSVGTLVVEASLRSGALITARHAMEQGREVFAIPGSIHNPLARGCHQLIRQGAKLVETASDIVDELHGLLAGLDASNEDDANARAVSDAACDNDAPDAEYSRLLAAMSWDEVDADTLASRSALTIAELSSMLLLLEMQGLVRSLSGGRYQRVKRSVE